MSRNLKITLVLFFLIANCAFDIQENLPKAVKEFFGQYPFLEKEVTEINDLIKKRKPSNLLEVLSLYFLFQMENKGF